MELNTIVSEVGTLVDIRDVSVNKELSRDERIAEFVQQIKNPYHFKCGRFTVQASFSAEGATLEECISTTERQGQIFTALDFSKCYLILKQATLTV